MSTTHTNIGKSSPSASSTAAHRSSSSSSTISRSLLSPSTKKRPRTHVCSPKNGSLSSSATPLWLESVGLCEGPSRLERQTAADLRQPRRVERTGTRALHQDGRGEGVEDAVLRRALLTDHRLSPNSVCSRCSSRHRQVASAVWRLELCGILPRDLVWGDGIYLTRRMRRQTDA